MAGKPIAHLAVGARVGRHVVPSLFLVLKVAQTDYLESGSVVVGLDPPVLVALR